MSSDTIDRIEARCTRIESRLTRFMLAFGLDTEGNPMEGTMVIDRTTANDILDALDRLLGFSLELPEDEALRYDVLFEKLDKMTGGRWDEPDRS